jgi:hypothetical protein
MHKVGCLLTRSALVVIFGAITPAVLGENLSRYREFQLGTDLATIAKQTGASATQAAVVHSRPALIQALSWRPQPLGPSSKAESAQEVVFSFYDGILSGIVVNYDRYETEGLTPDDMVEALSGIYGVAVKSGAPAKAVNGSSGGEEELLARWEDPQHRVELVRYPYGARYKLMAVLKRLEAPIQAAILDAKRIDHEEAPQRNAARLATEQDAAKAKLEKARVANKAKFRP